MGGAGTVLWGWLNPAGVVQMMQSSRQLHTLEINSQSICSPRSLALHNVSLSDDHCNTKPTELIHLKYYK